MTPTVPNRSRHAARHALAALAILLAAVVAACSPAPVDAASAEGAVLSTVSDAFGALAPDDGSDLELDDAGLGTSAADGPRIVVRRVDVERDVEVVDVVIDLAATPATATVDAVLRVIGTAEIWQLGHGIDTARSLLGEKPMELTGAVRFDLELRGRSWQVVGVRRAPLVQGPDAADLGPWAFSPSKPIAGAPVVAAVDVDAPQPEDRFVVRAHARFLVGLGRFNDAGLGADAVADDGTFTAFGQVEPSAREGVRLVLFSALNHSATTDLSVDGDGAYARPYTETILPAWVYVRVAD